MTDHCQQEFGYGSQRQQRYNMEGEAVFLWIAKHFRGFSLIEAVSADHEKCRHDPASEHTAGSGKKSPPASCRLRFQIQVSWNVPETIRSIPSPLARLKYPSPQGPAYIGFALIEFTLHPPHLLCPSGGNTAISLFRKANVRIRAAVKRRIAEILKPVQSPLRQMTAESHRN